MPPAARCAGDTCAPAVHSTSPRTETFAGRVGRHVRRLLGAVPGHQTPHPAPLPPDLGGPPTDDGADFKQWGSSIAPVADNQVTVLLAGMLTRWNPADGRQIGTPAPVRADCDGLRCSAHKAMLEPGWQHPEQAVVVQPSGDVELWNLDEHRVTAHLGRARPDYQGAVRFSTTGSCRECAHRRGTSKSGAPALSARWAGRSCPAEICSGSPPTGS